VLSLSRNAGAQYLKWRGLILQGAPLVLELDMKCVEFEARSTSIEKQLDPEKDIQQPATGRFPAARSALQAELTLHP